MKKADPDKYWDNIPGEKEEQSEEEVNMPKTRDIDSGDEEDKAQEFTD